MKSRKIKGLSNAQCNEVLRTCGCHNLRRASRLVTQLYDDALAPSGLRATQVVVLVTLAAEEEITMTNLARQLVLSPSTLSRNLKPLERDGLVEVSALPRRGKIVRLAESGQRALMEAVPFWQRAQKRFTDLVGQESWDELSDRLSSAVAAIRQ